MRIVAEPPVRPDDAGFSHPALLYRSRDEFVDQLSRFVRAELAMAHPVAVAVPSENLRLLRYRFGQLAEQVRWIDMRTVGRNPGRILPDVLLSFADQHPGRRVAIVGEPIWPGRNPGEYMAAVQHEALINLAFADRAATVLCPYDITGLEPAARADAARTHPEIIEHGIGQASIDFQDPAGVAAEAAGPLPDPPGDAPVLVFFTADDLPHVRAFVENHGARLGLPPDRVDRLELAVHEAATNTVAHADGPGIIRIWRDRDQVICEIHDRGRIADPLVGRRPGRYDQEHGWGLLVINQVCDLVRLHSDATGTDLHLHITMPDTRGEHGQPEVR
jgi:anti-sigma regulatory factor (Ser/Thr protein kinase)